MAVWQAPVAIAELIHNPCYEKRCWYFLLSPRLFIVSGGNVGIHTSSSMNLEDSDLFYAIPDDLPRLQSDLHVLIVFADQLANLQFPLINQAVIGRRCREDSQPPDVDLAQFGAYPAGVSRRHCLLRRHGSQVALMDLGSSNGTYLSEYRLQPHVPTSIMSGEVVWFGRLQARIYYR
jgi:hypothetical protein